MNTISFSLLADYVADYASFPEQASTFGETNDSMYWYITIICLISFAGVAGCLFGFAIKYRKPKGEPAESQVAHHTVLELAWSILPSLVLIWMFYKGAVGYLDQRTVPDGAFEVRVNAKKWSWLMTYGRTKHPELHLLKDEPTKLIMESDDVIHSLYVPAFRAKKDIVPGRYNYMWFKPTVANEKVSEKELNDALKVNKDQPWDYNRWQFTPDGYKYFDLFCTEYCGKDHSIMQTVVVVHETQEELDAWIEAKGSRDESISLEDWGRGLYEQRGCKSCHSLDGSRGTGPSYKDTFGSEQQMASGDSVGIDENYIRESILYPKAKVRNTYAPVMPSYKGQLTDDDIDSLIAFIKAQSKNAKDTSEKKTEEKPE